MTEQRESFAALEVTAAHLAYPRRAMYRLLHAGAIFPKPVRLGQRAVGWRAEEIDEVARQTRERAGIGRNT